MTDELVPFAESLGVAGGDRLELSLGQERYLRGLLADRPPVVDADRWELELELRSQRRRWCHVHAVAVAMLQGLDVDVSAIGTNGELRRFLQDVRDELELCGRTLGVDVQSALERLATVALRATTR